MEVRVSYTTHKQVEAAAASRLGMEEKMNGIRNSANELVLKQLFAAAYREQTD